MIRRFVRTAFTLAAVAAIAEGARPSPAAAQERLAFTPSFASYYAVSRIRNVSDEDWESQRAAPALVARVTYRPSPRFGVEGSLGYAFSSLIVTEPAGIRPADLSRAGNLLYLSGRLAYFPRRSNLKLFGGAGMVRRGGEIWGDDFLDPESAELTDVTGVVGFAIRANVSPTLSLDLGVEANLYVSDPDGPDGTRYEERFQQDLLLTIGVPIALVR